MTVGTSENSRVEAVRMPPIGESKAGAGTILGHSERDIA
jgi:hypothetical protein